MLKFPLKNTPINIHTHTNGSSQCSASLTSFLLKYRYLRLNCHTRQWILDTEYFEFLGTCYTKRTYSIQLFLLFCHCRSIYFFHRHLGVILQAIRPLFGIERLILIWLFVPSKMKTIRP